jgi:hypothetical protein
MASMPMSVRLDDDLVELLSKGARRTRQKKQALVRLTLRRYLPEIIERESLKVPAGRITTPGRTNEALGSLDVEVSRRRRAPCSHSRD